MTFIQRAILAAVIFLAGIGVLVYSFIVPSPKAEVVTVKKGSISQTVNAVGRAVSGKQVDTGAETGGTVAKILGKTGDQVKKGQALAELDTKDIDAQIAQLSASIRALRSQMAVLPPSSQKKSEQKSPSPQPSLSDTHAAQLRASAESTYRARVSAAETKFSQSITGIQQLVNESAVKANEIVSVQTNEMFAGSPAQFVVPVTSPQARFEAEQQREWAAGAVSWIQNLQRTFSADAKQQFLVLVQTEGQLQGVRNYLVKLNDALNVAHAISGTTLQTYRSRVAGGLVTVDNLLFQIQQKRVALDPANNILEQELAAAKSQYEQELKRISNLKAPLSQQPMPFVQTPGSGGQNLSAPFVAQIDALQSQIAYLNTMKEKRVIRSPIDGKITRLEVTVGEVIPPQKPVVSIAAGDENLFVEAFVLESQIQEIQKDLPVRIEFEDIAGKTFYGRVIQIDTVSVQQNGISYRRVLLSLEQPHEGVKSAMNARVAIQSLTKENVVLVPERALIRREGKTFVRVKEPSGVKEVPVQLGIRNETSEYEVITGLSGGELLELPTKK